MHSYDGGEEEDLSVAEGETITLTERVNDEVSLQRRPPACTLPLLWALVLSAAPVLT